MAVVTGFRLLTFSRSSTICQTSKNTTTQLRIVLVEAATILAFITLGSSRLRFWDALALGLPGFEEFPSLAFLERYSETTYDEAKKNATRFAPLVESGGIGKTSGILSNGKISESDDRARPFLSFFGHRGSAGRCFGRREHLGRLDFSSSSEGTPELTSRSRGRTYKVPSRNRYLHWADSRTVTIATTFSVQSNRYRFRAHWVTVV